MPWRVISSLNRNRTRRRQLCADLSQPARQTRLHRRITELRTGIGCRVDSFHEKSLTGSIYELISMGYTKV